MSDESPLPVAKSISTYIEDGARIAAILLVWGILAAFCIHGLTELGLPFEAVWVQLGQLFGLTGLLNALLFVLYRTVDYWNDLS